jgi:hypothetical protein
MVGTTQKDDDDEDVDVPLQHLKPFGSGLRRKQITFVPEASKNTDPARSAKPPTPTSIANMYLSLVLPKDSQLPAPELDPEERCEVCQLPLDVVTSNDDLRASNGRRHEASLAHQVCLTHSKPPSALDRSRMGLAVLQAQGWDPDSGTGLGAEEQGMQYPIKPKRKDNNLGLGMEIPKNFEPKRAKVEKLDAKKSRKLAVDEKKRRERLQQHFYGNSDLEKYFGSG